MGSKTPSSRIFHLPKVSAWSIPHLVNYPVLPPFFLTLAFCGACCFAGFRFLVWLCEVCFPVTFIGSFSFLFIQTFENYCLSCAKCPETFLTQLFLYLLPSYFPLGIWISVPSLNDKVRVF